MRCPLNINIGKNNIQGTEIASINVIITSGFAESKITSTTPQNKTSVDI
jgi:hypothetical protein